VTDHVELLKRGYKAWNAGNLDELLSLCHPEITIRPLVVAVVAAGKYHGHEEARELFGDARASWNEFQIDPEDFVDAGERVVALIRIRLRDKEGVSIDGRVAHVVKFRDGLVVALEGYRDRGEAVASVKP
jgi:ketosteroid isomerase-like protein